MSDDGWDDGDAGWGDNTTTATTIADAAAGGEEAGGEGMDSGGGGGGDNKCRNCREVCWFLDMFLFSIH